MNAPHTTQRAAPSIEDVAQETADNLLLNAFESISVIVPPYVDNPATAILAMAHSLVAKLDSIETVLCHLRESIDFLAARPDGETVTIPTAEESERILGILKADWLRQHPEHTEVEYRQAMHRLEKLAGL